MNPGDKQKTGVQDVYYLLFIIFIYVFILLISDYNPFLPD